MFSLSMTKDHDALLIFRKGRSAWVEVRGAPGYAVDHQPDDPLHRFLDTLDPATVAKLMADGRVILNPKNTRTRPSLAACDRIFGRSGQCSRCL